MDDSFPIPARTGVARGPLDPTAVVPGPQPLDVSERSGPNIIVGEVLPSGRHRAGRPRRKVALSGAVLSAAGAVVTLALMMGNGGGHTASAAPRSVPSTPLPDLPDEPVAIQHSEQAPPPAAPVHTVTPASLRTSTGVKPAAAPRHTALTPEQRLAEAAAQWRAQMRRESARNAQVWAAAMRQAAARQAQAQQQPSAAGFQQPAGQQSGYGTHGGYGGYRHGGHQHWGR